MALNKASVLKDLPLVSREWKNGSNSSYHCTPFLHSLLTEGKKKEKPSICLSISLRLIQFEAAEVVTKPDNKATCTDHRGLNTYTRVWV